LPSRRRPAPWRPARGPARRGRGARACGRPASRVPGSLRRAGR
jgi:hypothetical protein